MKGVTDAKGLQNLRTATTRRIHTKPPHRGTAHLDMYLLSKEQQRLEQELAHLDGRRERISERLTGIQEEVAKLRRVAQQEEAGEMPQGSDVEPASKPGSNSEEESQKQWKTMSVDY